MHQQELQCWQLGHMLDFDLVLKVGSCVQHSDMGSSELFRAFVDGNSRQMVTLPSDALLD